MATKYPDVIPMIAYEDGPKAMDWLSSAFGFTERARMLDTGGRLSHVVAATTMKTPAAMARPVGRCHPDQRGQLGPIFIRR